MKPRTKQILKISLSVVLGFATMIGVVTLTNLIGQWCSEFLVAFFNSIHINISVYGDRVTFCALFGLWTMLFLFLIRRTSKIPIRTELTSFALIGLVLCFVAPVILAISYQSTVNQFGLLQDTYVTEWILFLEIIISGIVAGIWWSRTRIIQFGRLTSVNE